MLDKQLILNEINGAENLDSLEEIYRKYLGKKGKITLVFRDLKNLPKEERVKVAKEANELKSLIENKLKSKKEFLMGKLEKKDSRKFDITMPR